MKIPETQTFPLTACMNTYVHAKHKSFHVRDARQCFGQRLAHFTEHQARSFAVDTKVL